MTEAPSRQELELAAFNVGRANTIRAVAGYVVLACCFITGIAAFFFGASTLNVYLFMLLGIVVQVGGGKAAERLNRIAANIYQRDQLYRIETFHHIVTAARATETH